MNNKGNGVALIPLAVFLVVYLGSSILAKDFYAVSIIIPFLAAALTALIMNKKEKFEKKYGEFNIVFLGRLAEYKYFDMDKAIENALNKFKQNEEQV